MIFQEKKHNTGYTYDVEDVFGTIHIESQVQLDGSTLDDMVVVLLRQNLSAQTIKGEVETKVGKVAYTFIKRSQWDDEDEIKPCENTPTSTQRPESVYTQTLRSIARTLNWFKRFAGAFQEAWKKSNNK